jgi:hypothetical protein
MKELTITPRQLAGIVSHDLAERLRDPHVGFDDPSLRFYPDGSMYWRDDTGSLHRQMCDIFRRTEPAYVGHSRFRPLASFGNRCYLLTYPGSYAELLGKYDESGLHIGPAGGRPITPNEYDLQHMHVMVVCRRKLSPAAPKELADAVRTWFATVGSKGVFGESGISRLGPTLRYVDRLACFELDAHESGEHTLNSLILAILNWGIANCYPLDAIDLAAGYPAWNILDPNPRKYERVATSESFISLTD